MPIAQIDRNGRVVIPAEYRKALGVKSGDEVVVRLDGCRIMLMTPAQATREIQEEFRKLVPPGISMVDELLRERREEAAREEEESRLYEERLRSSGIHE